MGKPVRRYVKKTDTKHIKIPDVIPETEKYNAKLYVNTSRSNIFITLTDVKDNVIWSTSGGCLSVRAIPKRNKRYKMAPGTIINLSKLLNIKIRFFKIKMLTLVLKKTPRFKLKALFLDLASKGIRFQELISKIKFSFNGVRGKKQRRV